MNMRRWVWSLSVLAAASYALSGWAVVPPGEVGVVRRLGRVVRPLWQPGLHLGAPLGFDRLDRIRVREVRRLVVGLALTPAAYDEPGAGEFLTGDLNLVKVEAAIQYRVTDPAAYVLASDDVAGIVGRAAQASLARALARQGIDETLGNHRGLAANDTRTALETTAARYGLGIHILGVSLTDARPPSEVAEEFAAAQAARSDLDRQVNEASAYTTRTLTAGRATAKARIEQARGQADRAVTLARGRADRFLALLTEAQSDRRLTIRRLYLQAVRELWEKAGRKLVLTPDEPLDLTLYGTR